ncbi:MAG: carbon monoxide dehydrogenase subunit G [Chloroflexi bacterium]|nr:carbon monoxide dehydrogenase subunit G [Chloroflexota bacterium]
MKVEGSYTFAAPRNLVWPLLQDAQVLARVMPGCEKLDKSENNEFTGILKIKVGPVQGKFNGDVKLTDIKDPESYTIAVNGKGAPGFVKGTGALQLEADGDTTILHYQGDAQVGGRLASVGQRLLQSSAKAIIRQSLEGLGQQIQGQMMAEVSPATNGSGDTTPPPVQPPSQMQFATGVAKNMLEELIPPENREDVLTKALYILGGVILFNLISNWFINRIAKKVAKRIKKMQ